jgi:enamine deaminase RidA (YjgF/YER057c/UK114 family)
MTMNETGIYRPRSCRRPRLSSSSAINADITVALGGSVHNAPRSWLQRRASAVLKLWRGDTDECLEGGIAPNPETDAPRRPSAAAGNLAAVLAGAGALPVAPVDATGVLTRLPDTLDDPARAWPAAVRDELPGNLMITVALIVCCWLSWGCWWRCCGCCCAASARAGLPTAPTGQRRVTCASCASAGPSAAASCWAATAAGCSRPSRGRR